MALDSSGAARYLWDFFARAACNRAFQRDIRARLMALDSSGTAPELWDLFAPAASNRAF